MPPSNVPYHITSCMPHVSGVEKGLRYVALLVTNIVVDVFVHRDDIVSSIVSTQEMFIKQGIREST